MKFIIFILTLFASLTLHSQNDLDALLRNQNEHLVPYISVNELAMAKTDAIVLDAREKAEFEVSHLPKAIFVGYNSFDIDKVEGAFPNKAQKIVVYCTIGIRSENIANKLKKAGYSNVFNLYGGIFEWKNQDRPVLDSNGNETEMVHTFSKGWAKWLNKGKSVD